MRTALGAFPTPLHPLHNAAQIVPGIRCDLLVKRDDLAGFSMAGNKTRPLEFLVPDAVAQHAQVMVGAGRSDSNFIAALAQASAVAGLDCEILVPEPAEPTVTLRMARTAGARILPVPVERHELDVAVDRRVAALAAQGVTAYAVPRGGATPVGAIGYARAVPEIVLQLGNRRDVTLVVPIGSGGTVAGLLAGLEHARSAYSVIGVSTSRPARGLREALTGLADSCLAIIDPDREPGSDPGARLTIVDRTDGIRDDDVEAARLAFVHSGLVVDDHYGLPSLATALSTARDLDGGTVVVWHTGGMAGLGRLLDRFDLARHDVGAR